ncbi:MAG: alpha/beta hydrolase [Xanthomonadaceae bacterium]|jgi:predicted alpha/beta superfamily hydrolase|nr:alpha/beta hydrolase [Xanthomonadaceae bacterium]
MQAGFAVMRWRRAGLGLALLVAVVVAGTAQAQPDLSQTVGRTVADGEQRDYRFETFRLGSEDGERHYRVRVAIPKAGAPALGYPVLYMLDGNAALMSVSDSMLGALRYPPVLVFIGYDNDLRIDAPGRAYDYTPLWRGDIEGQAAQGRQDVVAGRRTGGADAFLALLETQVKPAVEALAPIDRRRQSLWGHSYGGMFVLHALFVRRAAFQTYIAVDPSLWWGEGFILDEAKRFMAAHDAVPDSRLILLRGTGESPRQRPPPDASRSVDMEKVRTARAAAPPGAAQDLIRELHRETSLRTEYRELPGLSHGQTLGVSVGIALELAGEPASAH